MKQKSSERQSNQVTMLTTFISQPSPTLHGITGNYISQAPLLTGFYVILASRKLYQAGFSVKTEPIEMIR